MSKPKKSIHKSFDEGNKGEEIVKAIFHKKGIPCEKSDGKLNHDLKVGEGESSYHLEVKYDIMSRKTGNVAIEHFNTKKGTNSGITATTAKNWVHIAFTKAGEQQVWIAEVDELKKWLLENKPKKSIINGGDDNAALYIYDMDVIFGDTGVFKRLDTDA